MTKSSSPSRLDAFFGNPAAAVGMAVVCNVLWGSAFPFIKMGYRLFAIDATDTASIMCFAGVRFMLSALLVYAGGAALRRGPLPMPKGKNLLSCCGLGLWQTAAQYTFYYSAVALLTGAMGGILNSTQSFMGVILAHFLYGKADRMTPRMLYKESLDEILSEPFDFNLVKPCVESKVFGIGVEAYTVGSAEFALSYAAMNKDKCIPLLDNGHYHPTEVVSDKIPAMLTFFPEIALHITRGVRWDSDHVVLFDDETKEIAKEIVRCGGLSGRVKIALDYFDASINRIGAWVTGFRNVQKALLFALLQPTEELTKLQNEQDFTSLMIRAEELKTMPFGDVWAEYCKEQNVPADDMAWLSEIKKYENEVLLKR